ncbi:hypothetical protein QE416_000628 [Microbacterium sp. SORGH_AS 421]|nr:hypothetical protein [Microbacterium sp. SORGH_AS_0421]
MEVVARGVLRDLALRLVRAVAVRVAELRELVALRDVDLVVDDVDAHGVEQTAGRLDDGDVLGAVGRLGALEHEDLAGGGGVPATGVDRAGGQHREVAVAEEGQPRDLGVEALGAQVHQRVVGIHGIQAQTVSGGVGAALAVLRPGGGDAHDARLGAEDVVRDDGEARRARGLPLDRELLTVGGLGHLHEEVVDAHVERDGALDRFRSVEAVVVDQLRAVESEARTVVARQTEGIRAGGADGEIGQGVRDEVVTRTELLVGAPVDRRHELVDVGGLSRFERAELGEGRGGVGAKRHTRFLLGQVRRGVDGGGDGGTGGQDRSCGHECSAQETGHEGSRDAGAAPAGAGQDSGYGHHCSFGSAAGTASTARIAQVALDRGHCRSLLPVRLQNLTKYR